jgi:DNA-binding SARP family transcriptional activator
MEFFLLGPVLAAVAGQPVELGRRRERLLLALLLLEVGKPVTVTRLIELLWEDDLPRDPRAAVHVHVSRLRQRLAAAGAGRHGVSMVRTGAGYLVQARPDSVDLHRFAALVALARDTGEPAERARVLHGALKLWRGELMADVAPAALRQRLGSELAELRLTALEMRVAADLELGRHDALIPELAGLTAEHPARERLIAARMLALYRAGRQRDALAVYAQAARTLAEQFGLDTGSELRELRTAILRQEPPLAAGAPRAAVPSPAAPKPAQLPADTSHFVGRAELAALLAMADAQPGRPEVVTIIGMAGAGKTALAVRTGHQLAARYPDGQLFLDLHGFTAGIGPVTPLSALDRMLRSLGLSAEQIPAEAEDRAALLRSYLADRRVLIVLANAAAENQVTLSLPASPGCLVLITSRLSLAGLDGY